MYQDAPVNILKILDILIQCWIKKLFFGAEFDTTIDVIVVLYKITYRSSVDLGPINQ